MTVSVLDDREAAVARRAWRAKWLADVKAATDVDSELGRRLGGSLVDQAREQADRWWGKP